MQNIITLDDIVLNQPPEPHEDAITRCGQMLVANGSVTPRYIEGMIARDRGFSVAVGSYLAIPHGERDYKKDILRTSLVVLTYPEGLSWGDETVHLVIGIAAQGEEHLSILENIVDKLEDGEDVLALVRKNSKQAIYDLLTGDES